jgi:reactive intermediate/imine deaminase
MSSTSFAVFLLLVCVVNQFALSFQPIHISQKTNEHKMAPNNIEVRTENAPDPLGPYSQAVLAGKTLYCSGNIAIDPKTGEIVGDGDVQEETRQVLKNMNAVLEKAGASPANVVRCTVFLDNLQNFVRFLLKGNVGMLIMFAMHDSSFPSFLSTRGTLLFCMYCFCRLP